LSFIKGVLEGERSFASDLLSSDPSMKRVFRFVLLSIMGIVSFYVVLGAGILAINRVYLIITSVDLLAKLASERYGVSAFLASASFAISLVMQVRKGEFNESAPMGSGVSGEDKLFRASIIRRYVIDNSIKFAREGALLVRGFLPLASIPTLVDPLTIDSVVGVYSPKGFLKTISELTSQGLIVSTDKSSYDRLIQTKDNGKSLTDLSALTADELLDAIFSNEGEQPKKMNVPRCQFRVNGGGFLVVAAFGTYYQAWNQRGLHRKPIMKKTTVLVLLGLGNEEAVLRIKGRLLLKLFPMNIPRIP
jgi:hypothetical protein